MKPITDQSQTTGLKSDASRAEFACRLAKRLMMFPLAPQPGDTLEQHAACLEVAYAGEITKALNEEATTKSLTLPLSWKQEPDGDMRLWLGSIKAGVVFHAGEWRAYGQEITDFSRTRHSTKEAAMNALEEAVTAFIMKKPDDEN